MGRPCYHIAKKNSNYVDLGEPFHFLVDSVTTVSLWVAIHQTWQLNAMVKWAADLVTTLPKMLKIAIRPRRTVTKYGRAKHQRPPKLGLKHGHFSEMVHQGLNILESGPLNKICYF